MKGWPINRTPRQEEILRVFAMECGFIDRCRAEEGQKRVFVPDADYQAGWQAAEAYFSIGGAR